MRPQGFCLLLHLPAALWNERMDGDERFARRPCKELAVGRRRMAELVMKQTRRKFVQGKQAGFTLVELMIASIVLTVGLLALSGLLAIGILNNNRNKVDT